MARRNSTQTIQSFPAEINREYFGQWLSGFVDGEGCFTLTPSYVRSAKCKISVGKLQTPHANFAIQIRADDKPILLAIQSYWSCGLLYFGGNRPRPGSDTKPRWQYQVQPIRDLIGILVPHFLKYPLLAKKKTDFLIWKEGIELIYSVATRRAIGRPRKGDKPTTKWKDNEVKKFDELAFLLRRNREYVNIYEDH